MTPRQSLALRNHTAAVSAYIAASKAKGAVETTYLCADAECNSAKCNLDAARAELIAALEAEVPGG